MPTIGAAVMAAEREGANTSLLPIQAHRTGSKQPKISIGKFGKKKEPDGLEYSQVEASKYHGIIIIICVYIVRRSYLLIMFSECT